MRFPTAIEPCLRRRRAYLCETEIFGSGNGTPSCAGRGSLSPIKWHEATRHTVATLGAAQGISARVMQERLGHARLETTLAVYTHPTAELHERAADQLDAAMFDANRDANAGVQTRIRAEGESSK